MAKTNRWGAMATAAGTLVAVGLVLLKMLVVVEARPAGATFPGQNGKIALTGVDATSSGQEGTNGDDWEIYTINPDGGGRFQVTDNTTHDYDPSYSPDGNRMSYASSDGYDFEIYTIYALGWDRVKLTDNFMWAWRNRPWRRQLRKWWQTVCPVQDALEAASGGRNRS